MAAFINSHIYITTVHSSSRVSYILDIFFISCRVSYILDIFLFCEVSIYLPFDVGSVIYVSASYG